MRDYVARFFGGGKPSEERVSQEKEKVERIPLDHIHPNRYQPRRAFEPEPLDELARSMANFGLLQPVIVRPLTPAPSDEYELVAGERRLRAAKMLGWTDIPAIVRKMGDIEAASLALIENLQRESLNPLEEAEAYSELMRLYDLTQEALAQRLGKGQSTIANKLRLLQLPDFVKQGLAERKITERHARALLPLKDDARLAAFYVDMLKGGWTVKETEKRVQRLLEPKAKKLRFGKAIPRDLRLAVNTIRQSVHMVEESGLIVDMEENDEEDYYVFTIRLPKRPQQKRS
ncbi:MAG: Chromosome (plasmid) partitioning protein ParB [Candidatus Carbobacillus altaicus]|uniref:Chromosome (Plasmid) partitioning protein ParB n=1 Tax=Candidatus Carbonibacillus altaicus TaxID=2163959 RepID=A0A2R6Y1Z6_9BACL|nr:MAG: Chromosome (plasmid) partitioning protein ParB [Candidatus Carbobacillus altaicus]